MSHPKVVVEKEYVTSSVMDEQYDLLNDSWSDASFVSAHSTLEDEPSGPAYLLQLPPEILHRICEYLKYQHLVCLIRTSRQLKAVAENDLLWHRLLREQLFPVEALGVLPYPSPTFRHLYMAHSPYWFIPKYKIWISDKPLVGKLILCKFDARRGCIEGYQLLAERGPATGVQWSQRPSVLIHNFSPRVHLWMDDPVLNLSHGLSGMMTARQGWWEGEVQMSVGRSGHNTAASFFLARDVPEEYQSLNMELWPPRTIPNMPRTRSASGDRFMSKGHKPQTHDEISETTFRIRSWSQFFTGFAHVGVRLGEEVSTWSTLDPSLYTPTTDKPYQGIFVGDYAGHGCEFLLILQTDLAPPPRPRTPNEQMQAVLRAMQDQLDNMSGSLDDDASFITHDQQPVVPNVDNEAAHTGALEAIKLTGDPNIPRGEHTFIADDIGPDGLIRIATEEPFRGARVVKSRGHIAGRGFHNDEYIPSQLFLINSDRLAQYWMPFGHISYYERIDIDALLASTTYHRRASS